MSLQLVCGRAEAEKLLLLVPGPPPSLWGRELHEQPGACEEQVLGGTSGCQADRCLLQGPQGCPSLPPSLTFSGLLFCFSSPLAGSFAHFGFFIQILHVPYLGMGGG